MGKNTDIAWCHHTFNAWRGCTKVSPGCTNCYAEKLSHRNPATLGVWGDDGARAMAAESYWRQLPRWNAAAEKAGERHRVFCMSLGDVLEDRPELHAPRSRLMSMVPECPALDFLFLTKRPENRLMHGWGDAWPVNAWLGISAEDQARLDERATHAVKVNVFRRFISAEPLLGPLQFGDAMSSWLSFFDLVIVGGESGGSSRPFQVQWARDIIGECAAAGVACFVKQLGSWPSTALSAALLTDPNHRLRLRDRKGGDWDEWTGPLADLRVRQMPGQPMSGGLS